ncbi:hypothetical protein BpHYR1_014108 [Brachionus plicatilis]|uniref:Uncharacterized protein n=1 Tax=Brachionus plicatilis TaxID=10195 RepID=A0A3M7Q797_BRAPC|nr:hypothetical protein BpHYR1_014108 [Brachionus plicatilis]
MIGKFAFKFGRLNFRAPDNRLSWCGRRKTLWQEVSSDPNAFSALHKYVPASLNEHDAISSVHTPAL